MINNLSADGMSAGNIMPNTTLAELVQPLLTLLNEKYPSPEGDYYAGPFGAYGKLGDPPNIIAVDLNADTITDLARRAVLTLVSKTGSHKVWFGGKTKESDPYKAPLRFSIMKESMHVEAGWAGSLYLIIDYFDPIDPKEAANQVAMLLDYLSDESNLISLSSEELALV